jgi:hypothetical protein
MLWLGRLERAEVRWLVRFFATQHSVLGGEVLSADFAQVQHRAMMVSYPLAFLKYLLEVSFFVVALATTKDLVCMILNEQRPDMIGVLRSVLLRSREVLVLSLKYIAVLTLFGAAMVVIGSSPLTSDRIHELALSKAFIYVFALAGQACLAWLLLPAAIRLLRPPRTPLITKAGRRLGTAFAVASSGCALLLEYFVGKVESAFTFDKPWESHAIAMMNTAIIDLPQVLLFIALALLALQIPAKENPPSEEQEIV